MTGPRLEPNKCMPLKRYWYMYFYLISDFFVTFWIYLLPHSDTLLRRHILTILNHVSFILRPMVRQ